MALVPGPSLSFEVCMNATLRFITTIRFFLLIKTVQVLSVIWPTASEFVGERSRLNAALRRFLEGPGTLRKVTDADAGLASCLYAIYDPGE
jgi:hypothetical protein